MERYFKVHCMTWRFYSADHQNKSYTPKWLGNRATILYSDKWLCTYACDMCLPLSLVSKIKGECFVGYLKITNIFVQCQWRSHGLPRWASQVAHLEDQIEEENEETWEKIKEWEKIRKSSSLAHPRLRVWVRPCFCER